MIKPKITAACLFALGLAACSSAQVASTSADVAAAAAKLNALAVTVDPSLVTACNAATALAGAGAAIPGVAAVSPWVTAGCTSAEGLLKLAGDPSSLTWVSGLISQMAALMPQKTA